MCICRNARVLRIADHRFRKEDARLEVGLLVTGEAGQVGNVDDHQPSRPRLGIDRRAGVTVRRVPGDELTRLYEAAFASTAGQHRLRGADAEDVFAARLHGVPTGLASHQKDAALVGGSPHPHLLHRHPARLATARTFKTTRCRVSTVALSSSLRTSWFRAPSVPLLSIARPSTPRS
jgi:hypothetical protein